MEPSTKDQILIDNNQIIPFNYQNKIAKCTAKIFLPDNGKGSGFFTKFKRNNKLFYCLLTNQHVIEPEMIVDGYEIIIKYDNESKELKIKLDKQERIILCLKKILKIDVTLIEIIPKDKIDDSYFLIPKTIDSLSSLIGKNIQIIQYPLGGDLSFSNGKIKEVYNKNENYFFHDASTEAGSSGSPIAFDGEDKVFAIHKGASKDSDSNVGIFIRNIIEMMKDYKKNGKYREYYDNGNLKYEGNFKDDEYDDEDGKFIFENGNRYNGHFKNGKKHGAGSLFNNNNEFIKQCEYENDVEIIREANSNNDERDDEEENNGNNFLDFNDLLRKGLEIFKPVGDIVGAKCTRCRHETKFHSKIVSGKYKCEKCPEDSNICIFKFKKN